MFKKRIKNYIALEDIVIIFITSTHAAKTSGIIDNLYTSQFFPNQKLERERANQTSQHLMGLDDHDLIVFDSMIE